jgi:SAM-dependent methyltransferase
VATTTLEIRFDPTREEAELREYLDAEFELDRLWHYQEQLDAEVAAAPDEATFYRTSRAYLYNLTAFAMTGTKLPYVRELTRRVPPGARVLDYGSGIGSDGLMLLEAGYRVEFAEFENPSVEYLRWRLAHRGLDARIHDLSGEVPAGFDAAYAFDVIEHVDYPFNFLAELERRARLVEVNFLESEPDDQELHRDLPIRSLLAHTARQRLLYYGVLHGRSHLVLYEPKSAATPTRLINIGRVLGVRLRAVIGSLR